MGISILDHRHQQQQITESAVQPETNPTHRTSKIMFTAVSNVIGKLSENAVKPFTQSVSQKNYDVNKFRENVFVPNQDMPSYRSPLHTSKNDAVVDESAVNQDSVPS